MLWLPGNDRVHWMKPEEATQRLMLSRQTHHGWAMALANRDLKAPPAEYQRMIREEAAVLRRIAMHHPAKAETVGHLVEKYEALSKHIGRLEN